jgi:hypothetical protein
MGYTIGSTNTGGVTIAMRHKVLGACMDQNIATWLLRSIIQAVEPQCMLNLGPMTYQAHLHNSEQFPDSWIVDGGATSHFTGHRSDFTSMQQITPKLVKGMNLNAVAIGTVRLQVPAVSKTTQRSRTCTISLNNVLYVPDMLQQGATVTRLLSQRASHKAHNATGPVFIDAAKFSVVDMGTFYLPLDQTAHPNLITLHSKVQHTDEPAEIALTAVASHRALPRPLWHQRLGHISTDRLTRTMHMSKGITLKAATAAATHCQSCAITKSVRFASGNGTTRRDYLPFEKIGVDIWSHSTPSVRRFLHIIGFTCYRTGYLVLYLMHTKDESVTKEQP